MTTTAAMKDGELCRKEFEAWLDSDASATRTARSKYYTAQEQVLGFLAWQASRQPLQSQLAIAREALDKLVAAYKIGTNGLFDCLPEYRDEELSRMRSSAWVLALKALAAISLDKPAEAASSIEQPVGITQELSHDVKARLREGRCPNCNESIGTMAASSLFHKCKATSGHEQDSLYRISTEELTIIEGYLAQDDRRLNVADATRLISALVNAYAFIDATTKRVFSGEKR